MAKHSVYAASKVFGEEKFHVVLLFLSSRVKCVTEDPLTEKEMEAIRLEDKNCRLVKGQVFLWEGAKGWEDLWDLDGTITGR